jgi:hypothetical protein
LSTIVVVDGRLSIVDRLDSSTVDGRLSRQNHSVTSTCRLATDGSCAPWSGCKVDVKKFWNRLPVECSRGFSRKDRGSSNEKTAIRISIASEIQNQKADLVRKVSNLLEHRFEIDFENDHFARFPADLLNVNLAHTPC